MFSQQCPCPIPTAYCTRRTAVPCQCVTASSRAPCFESALDSGSPRRTRVNDTQISVLPSSQDPYFLSSTRFYQHCFLIPPTPSLLLFWLLQRTATLSFFSTFPPPCVGHSLLVPLLTLLHFSLFLIRDVMNSTLAYYSFLDF
jgi:hypothetical protein